MFEKVEKMNVEAGGLGIVCGGVSSLNLIPRPSCFQSNGNLGVARKMNTMKKLMFAAAALAAGFAMADVVSSNVVGYQNKATKHGEFNALVATFAQVGTDGSTSKLGSLKALNTTWDGSTLYFISATGGMDKFTDPDLGEVFKRFYFINASEAEEYSVDEGWYQAGDEDSIYLMNDRIDLPYGQGFVFDAQDEGAQLCFAGEVKNGATLKTVHGKFNMVGNVTPVDLKLGDFTCNNTTWDGSTVYFISTTGGMAKFTDEDLGTVFKRFYFLNPSEAEEYSVDAGWYQAGDEDSVYLMNDKIDVPAGAGIVFDAQDSGAEFVVPKVLTK